MEEETTTRPEAPTGYYYATIKGKDILVKNINEAQSMVLGGMLRDINQGPSGQQIMAIFGKLMALLNALITLDEQREWLEDQILIGNIEIGDFATVFKAQGKTDTPAVKAKPRRAR